MREAVEWACEQGLLDGFVREQKENIIGMCLTEFNEEIAIQNWREDGIIEGREQGLAEGARQKAVEDALVAIKEFGASPELAAEKMGAPLDLVLEALKASQARLDC